MQRYRVNYVLLIGLVVGSIVAAGAVYGVWSAQMSLKSGVLLDRATVAEEAGELDDLQDAANNLQEYVRFRPDEDETRIRLVRLRIKLLNKMLEEQDTAGFMGVKQQIDGAMYGLQGEDDLRAEWVEFLTTPGMIQQTFAKDAASHIKVLLSKRPDDADLLMKQATSMVLLGKHREAADSLYMLVGYDIGADTKTFDGSKALAANNIEAYQLLTNVLISKLKRRKLADLLQVQMIKENPESADAYLAQARYLFAMDRGEGSRDDFGEAAADSLKKAYQLDPKNTDVLLQLTRQAQIAKDYDLAKKYLEEGLAIGTDIGAFYGGLARLERAKGNQEKASEYIEQGMERVKGRAQWPLMLQKVEIQIASKEFTAAKQTLKSAEALVGGANARIEFYEAYSLFSQEEWIKAARALKDVRRNLLGDDYLRARTDTMLGLCYEKQGKADLALQAFENALVTDSKNMLALAGKRRNTQKIGPAVSKGRADELDVNGKMKEMLARPEDKQNWKEFDAYIDKFAESQNYTDVYRDLLKIRVFAARGKYDEAKELLREVYKKAGEDMGVWLTAVRLEARDPDGGPERGLKILDRVVEQFGDQPQLRLERANLLIAINNEDLAETMLQLGENTGEWDERQKVQLWRGLAQKLASLGKRDEAEQAWQRVAELEPGDLITLTQLFELANGRNDDEAMIDLQKKILALGDGKEDSTWALTEAARLYSLHRRGKSKEGTSDAILKLIETALEERDTWAAPYFLRANLAYFEHRWMEAIDDYRKGFSRGRGSALAISQYVRLLSAQGNFSEAIDALEPYDPSIRLALLRDTYATILLRVGKFSEASEAAQKLADSKPDDPKLQLWYGKFMQQLAGAKGIASQLSETSLAKSGIALSSSVELDPSNPQAWLSWITYLLVSKDAEGAGQAIRAAQLALDEDRQPLLLARCYEMMGRWFDAENLYRLTLEQNPDNTLLTRQLAAFYLSPRYRGKEGRDKAALLVNDLLKRQAKEGSSVRSSDANWARRTAAKMLAKTGDYQNLLQAEKLLASNSQLGTLGIEDKLEMAKILSTRPEPVSRKKATLLLEEVKQQQPLDAEMSLKLAQLYFQGGSWPLCRSEMSTLLTKYPQFTNARNAYIRMLLQRGGRSDLEIAGKQIQRLVEIAPDSPQTVDLLSLVYKKQGKNAEARRAILRLLPGDTKELAKRPASLIRHVADVLAGLDDLDSAEKLYTLLANRPGATVDDAVHLARFVGAQRDAERGFEMLEKIATEADMAAIVSAGLTIIQARREEFGDAYDARVEVWIAKAEREDPGSVSTELLKARFFDLQKRYGKAAEINRSLLSRNELAEFDRAIIMNNLAYLLALGAAPEAEPNEAAKLVQETTQILGPIADILDTRAVILNGRGEFKAAVRDLELAVIDKPTASSYFHKTIAHLGLKQRRGAIDSWEKAVELGLTRETINPLEQEKYDEVESEVKALLSRSDSL